MIDWFKHYNEVLGLNERNLLYIREANPAKLRKVADDKILTKKVLAENGISTPLIIDEICSLKELERFEFSSLPDSMVVKPKRGFGGEGILVFFSKDREGKWVKADKARYSQADIKDHIVRILEGDFSLKNKRDTAFFEERVLMHPVFKKVSYRGIPDIRVIVFNKVPIMAMLRLTTKESDGKANLHAGGVAVGIDIASGVTTNAIHHDRIIERHPDTDAVLRGIRIPFWKRILELAVNTQVCTGIGFLGVDIVIDRMKGPMVLELNARPGLAIQIANLDGLKGRLERVKGLSIPSVKRGVSIGRHLFGGEVVEEIEEVSGKQLVGKIEYAVFYGKNGDKIFIKVRNDTGALWSSLDEEVVRKLGYGDVLDRFAKFHDDHPFSNLEEGKKIKLIAQRRFEDDPDIAKIALVKQSNGLSLRPVIKITFEMSGIKQISGFTVINRKGMIYRCIVGRKALGKYLVDPAQKFLGGRPSV